MGDDVQVGVLGGKFPSTAPDLEFVSADAFHQDTVINVADDDIVRAPEPNSMLAGSETLGGG